MSSNSTMPLDYNYCFTTNGKTIIVNNNINKHTQTYKENTYIPNSDESLTHHFVQFHVTN